VVHRGKFSVAFLNGKAASRDAWSASRVGNPGIRLQPCILSKEEAAGIGWDTTGRDIAQFYAGRFGKAPKKNGFGTAARRRNAKFWQLTASAMI
jgi:hypothetical protein